MDHSLSNFKSRPSVFKRLVALIFDFIILGIIGYISGLFLESFYVSLGKYGTLMGSAITIIYFSICQSFLFKGQTIGKRILNIKVTDLNGQYLSLGKSVLRSSIIFLPVMNVEILSNPNAFILLGTVVILSILATIYLILVNKSRRCLHDILVSSVVTNENVDEFQLDESNDRSRKKLIPIGVIAAAMISFGIYQAFSQNTFSQLLSVKSKIEDQPGVVSVKDILFGTTTIVGTNKPSERYTSVTVTVRIDDANEASNVDSKYFNDFYEIIKAEIPESSHVDKIIISLYYGYNIVIASKTKTVTQTIEYTQSKAKSV